MATKGDREERGQRLQDHYRICGSIQEGDGEGHRDTGAVMHLPCGALAFGVPYMMPVFWQAGGHAPFYNTLSCNVY